MKKKTVSQISYYRYKNDNKQYIYSIQLERFALWKRLLHRFFYHPPHMSILYEKVIIIYEE